MKRIVTLLSLIAAALRYSGHLASVIDEPLAQAATVYGPVPTGLVPLVATLFGSTIEAGACPSRNGRFGSGFFILITTVSASGVAISAMLWNRLLSLLVLAGAADRSNENFTVSAFERFAVLELDALAQLEGVGLQVRRRLPSFRRAMAQPCRLPSPWSGSRRRCRA